ncbi:hypothetical protein [Streptomyces sp. NPDC014733]|uniref:hypothetical protein n=1 Tax=Streptomyces sp. NPDC014733 TaxID=3364885 RepID=UPI0036FD721C
MSTRYLLARTARFTVRNVIPFAVAAGAMVGAAQLTGIEIVAIARLEGGTDVLLATAAAVLGWDHDVTPRLERMVERLYLAGATTDQWLAHFELQESWQAPSPTAAAFRAEHGDPAHWTATDYETHQNLVARRAPDDLR